MRWGSAGANALLRVRRAVLNGLDVRHVKRWYLRGGQLVDLPEWT